MAVPSLRQTFTLSKSANATLLGEIDSIYSNTIHFSKYKSEYPFVDNYGNEYSNAYSIVGKGSGSTPTGSAVYYIAQRYTSLSGTVVLSQNYKNAEKAGRIYIYGDDKLLFDSGNIGKGSKPIAFSLDIGRYEQLKIVSQDGYHFTSSDMYGWVRPYLVDLYLS